MENKPKKPIPYGSNSLRLSPKGLLLVVVLTVLAVFVASSLWYRLAFEVDPMAGDPDDHFRFSYAYRDDYCLYNKVVDNSGRYDALFLGDSVIWGMYVNNESTLTECLNRKTGKHYGNLAIDGLHPVAMRTLVKEHTSNFGENRPIFLYFNPLWVNTPEYDLTGNGDISVNHPKLLPQLDFSIKANKLSLSERCKALLERKLTFYGMLRHLQLVSFGNKDLKSFLAKNPGTNPLKNIHVWVDALEHGHTLNSKIDWYNSGLPEQDWPWVKPADSRQWQAFLDTCAILQKRGAKLTVLLGAINTHMLTKESAERFAALRAEHHKILNELNIKTIELPVLPSNEYGDASHPLAPGYERLAEYLADKIQHGDDK